MLAYEKENTPYAGGIETKTRAIVARERTSSHHFLTLCVSADVNIE
jgi:hypothetical protein